MQLSLFSNIYTDKTADIEHWHLTSATFQMTFLQQCLSLLFTWLEVIKIHTLSPYKELQQKSPSPSAGNIPFCITVVAVDILMALYFSFVHPWSRLLFSLRCLHWNRICTATVKEQRLQGVCLLLLYATAHVKGSLKLFLKGCKSDYMTMKTKDERLLDKRVSHKQHSTFVFTLSFNQSIFCLNIFSKFGDMKWGLLLM